MIDDIGFKQPPNTILVIEDDAPDIALVSREIRKLWPQCTIKAVKSMKEARALYEGADIDMVLLDLNLLDCFGPQTVEDARKFIKVPIIAMTSMVSNMTVSEALKNGANNIVSKKDIMDEDFKNILEQNAT